MKPMSFALRRPFQVIAALLTVVLGAVFAGSYQQVGSLELTARESQVDCAEARNILQPAPNASTSRPKKELSRALARSVIAARLIRRREKTGAVRLVFKSIALPEVRPLFHGPDHLRAVPDQPPFVCHGMAAASWGLPSVLLSRNDRATI